MSSAPPSEICLGAAGIAALRLLSAWRRPRARSSCIAAGLQALGSRADLCHSAARRLQRAQPHNFQSCLSVPASVEVMPILRRVVTERPGWSRVALGRLQQRQPVGSTQRQARPLHSVGMIPYF